MKNRVTADMAMYGGKQSALSDCSLMSGVQAHSEEIDPEYVTLIMHTSPLRTEMNISGQAQNRFTLSSSLMADLDLKKTSRNVSFSFEARQLSLSIGSSHESHYYHPISMVILSLQPTLTSIFYQCPTHFCKIFSRDSTSLAYTIEAIR